MPHTGKSIEDWGEGGGTGSMYGQGVQRISPARIQAVSPLAWGWERFWSGDVLVFCKSGIYEICQFLNSILLRARAWDSPFYIPQFHFRLKSFYDFLILWRYVQKGSYQAVWCLLTTTKAGGYTEKRITYALGGQLKKKAVMEGRKVTEGMRHRGEDSGKENSVHLGKRTRRVWRGSGSSALLECTCAVGLGCIPPLGLWGLYIATQSTHLTICQNTVREFLQIFGQKSSNSVKNNLCLMYLVSCFRKKWVENSVLVMMLSNKLYQM